MSDKQNIPDLEFELSEYLDGNLPAHEAARLEKLLAEDNELRQQLQDYASLNEGLSKIGRAELEDIDYDRQRSEVMAAIERKVLLEGYPARRRQVAIRWMAGGLAAAAAVLIVASLALQLFRSEPQPTIISSVVTAEAGLPKDVPSVVASSIVKITDFKPAITPAQPGRAAGSVLVSVSSFTQSQTPEEIPMFPM